MRWTLLLLPAIIGFAPIAQAQDVVREADRTVYKKKSTLDFSDVTLDGDLAKPMEGNFQGRSKTKFKRGIKFRPHFHPEMDKSRDQL